jgi:hypothetical protein
MAPLPLMQNLIETFLSWLTFPLGRARSSRSTAFAPPTILRAAHYHGCHRQ